MNCYILTGGRSTRMGRSKAELPFGGTTFLERIHSVAGAVFDHVIAVQRHGEERVLPETISEPPHDDEAVIFGVAAALGHAGTKCFVLALDYPLITAELLRFMARRFQTSDAPMVAPRWDGVVQTLCAGYSPTLAGPIAARIAEQRYDLQSLAASAEIIPEEEIRSAFPGEPLMNVNTPGQLELARQFLRTEDSSR